MSRSRYKPARFKSEKLHWIAANGWTREMRKCLLQGDNPYQPVDEEGLTPLHAAVANSSTGVVELLLQECYERDLKIAREEMRSRFLWKVENLAWTKRPMLIAHTEAECRAAKSLQCASPAEIPLNVQVFVFLRVPIDGLQLVALDVYGRGCEAKVMALIINLLPNGNLSLDISDFRSKGDSCLQLACYTGNQEILELLIRKGAQLSVENAAGRTPLMAACEFLQTDVVKLLLTKYSDRFDPTVSDHSGRTALYEVMLKGNAPLADMVLKAMIQHRMKRSKETVAEAFSRVFFYDGGYLASRSYWAFAGSRAMRDLCCKYIVEYATDMSLLVTDRMCLTSVIGHPRAVNYCYAAICRNLAILERPCYQEMNVLQLLVDQNCLDFVKKLYREQPTVKAVFETSTAFTALVSLFNRQYVKMLALVLQHHQEFLLANRDTLLTRIVRVSWFPIASYDRMYDMLVDAFPDLRDEVQITKAAATERTRRGKIQEFFHRPTEFNVEHTMAELVTAGTKLEEYVDDNDCTLLHLAIREDNLDAVSKLLELSGDWARCDKKGKLPWMYVRHEKMFELLQGRFVIDSSKTDNQGYNLLHQCCIRTVPRALLIKLVHSGFDVNHPGNDGHRPLTLAACCSTIEFLLDHNADIELIDPSLIKSQFSSTRYCAAMALIPRIAKLNWFQSIAQIYIPWMAIRQYHYSYSHECERWLEEHSEIRKILFDAMYRHSREKAENFFASACQDALNSYVGWFLDYNYDINYDHLSDYEYTPLQCLLSYMETPNAHLVQQLLTRGVDVNVTNDRKQNCILLIANTFSSARRYGHTIETIGWLLDNGGRINDQDENGNTALHYAFRDGELELAKFLLERGADVNIRNEESRFAFELGNRNNKLLFSFLRKQ